VQVSELRNCLQGLSLAFVLAALGGCVSAHKLDQALAVPIGMNEVQVANKVGEPPLKDLQKDGTERWIWSRKGQFGPESVILVMKDKRVAAIESEGERLKHLEELKRLEELDRVLQGKAGATTEKLNEREAVIARNVVDASRRREVTNAPPVMAVESPTAVKHEKSSDELERERQALEQTQRQERSLEEQTRQLVEKARLESIKKDNAAAETKSAEAKTAQPADAVPEFTAWHMARQFVSVSKELKRQRKLFPNPRFATGSAGEERVEGNLWRAWGYVDTVDSSNAPQRLQWTAELEFQGGTKWHLKNLSFGEK
jgi:hypothetical protein